MQHDETNSLTCLPGDDSDKPDQSSLWAWRNLWLLATLWVHSEASDQTEQMPGYFSAMQRYTGPFTQQDLVSSVSFNARNFDTQRKH